MKTLNMPKILNALMIVSLTTLAACGKAPTVDAVNNAVTQTKVVDGPTTSFTYLQSQQICDALRSWSPEDETIQFNTAPGIAMTTYRFANSGITQKTGNAAVNAIDYNFQIGVNNSSSVRICLLNITAGKLTSIQ